MTAKAVLEERKKEMPALGAGTKESGDLVQLLGKKIIGRCTGTPKKNRPGREPPKKKGAVQAEKGKEDHLPRPIVGAKHNTYEEERERWERKTLGQEGIIPCSVGEGGEETGESRPRFSWKNRPCQRPKGKEFPGPRSEKEKKDTSVPIVRKRMGDVRVHPFRGEDAPARPAGSRRGHGRRTTFEGRREKGRGDRTDSLARKALQASARRLLSSRNIRPKKKG